MSINHLNPLKSLFNRMDNTILIENIHLHNHNMIDKEIKVKIIQILINSKTIFSHKIKRKLLVNLLII